MSVIVPYGSSVTSFVTNEMIAPAGQVVPYAGISQPLGWLFCDGSTVSRGTYPRLFSALTMTLGSAVVSSGSDTVTGASGLTSTMAGWSVSGAGIPAGTLIASSGLTSTAFKMVNASGGAVTATASGTGVVIGPHGFASANNTTTFQLPDMRGRAPIGVGQGSGLSSRILGDATIGAEAHVLTPAQTALRTHQHYWSHSTGAVSTQGQSNDHYHHGSTGNGDWLAVYNHYSPGTGSSAYPVSTGEGGGRTVQGAGGGHSHGFSTGGTRNSANTANQDHTHRFDHSHSGLTGGLDGANGASNVADGAAHNNMPPSIVMNYIIKT